MPLTGNQVGCLMLEYILSEKEKGELPKMLLWLKLLLPQNLQKNSKFYGVELIEVLTGFKFIGEKLNS